MRWCTECASAPGLVCATVPTAPAPAAKLFARFRSGVQSACCEAQASGANDIGMSVSKQPGRKDINMRTQVDQYPHLSMWIASVAFLFVAAGIAAFMTWMPTAIGNPKDHATLAASSRIPIQPAGGRDPRRSK